MPHWMVHQQHGTMPVYSMSEVTQVQAHGWTLLNTGESPNLPPKVRPQEAAAPEAPAQSPGVPEAPVSEPAAPPVHPEPQRDALIPAVSLHEGRDEMAPVKRKPGRPPKVK